MRSACFLAGMMIGLSTAASAADVKLAASPVVSKDGAMLKISFTLAGSGDVEVAILDSQGKAVRRLAAGVLGGQVPPPPPLAAGLSQELVWDGADDLGQQVAAGGPFSVRIRAGMGVKLDGFVGESKYWIGELHGLATDPKGNLYVYSSAVAEHRGSIRYLQVFDRTGKYLRTIMPMPATLPPDKLKPFGALPAGDSFLPKNHFGTWPELYPGQVGQISPTVTADGLITISDGLSYARIRADGSAADEKFFMPMWPAGKDKSPYWSLWAGPHHVVPSPDGQYLYLTGMCYRMELGKDPEVKVNPLFPDGRIYRMKIGAGTLEKFADLPLSENARLCSETKGGFRAQDYHTARHGGVDRSCCDKDGNLLVCDRMNNMIRVLDPQGKLVDGFRVDSPSDVAIHRTTGAVYVLTDKYLAGKGAAKSLLKFSSVKPDAKQQASYDFNPKGYDARIILDDSDAVGPAVIWAAGELTGKQSLLRIEDRGDKFELTANLLDLNKDRFGVKPRMAVHPETELIICNDGWATLNAYNGVTGEQVKLPFEYGADMAVGLDGNWYIQLGNSYNGPICRYDKDLRPLPVAGADAKTPNAVGQVTGGRAGAGYSTFGLAADAKGRAITLQMYDWNKYGVGVFAEGKPVDCGRVKDDEKVVKLWGGALIAPIASKSGGIQVDLQGNIYLGLGVRAADTKVPAGFEKDYAFNGCVGGVVKFPAQGGAILALDPKNPQPPAGKKGLALRADSYPGGPRFVENAITVYPGLGCLAGNLGDSCVCRQPMFQVDRFGRLFYPNAIGCSVRIVDNAGNQIAQFGQYGNIDSAGQGSMIPTPAIPLGWPQAVGATEKFVYVSDVLNRRIVRLAKTFAVEQICPAK